MSEATNGDFRLLVKRPGCLHTPGKTQQTVKWLSDRRSSTHDQTHDRSDQEDDKKDISDVRGRTRHARKAKYTGNNRDYQKCYGPAQHDYTSLGN